MKKLSFVAVAIVLLLSAFALATYFYNSQKADDASANAQKNVSAFERDYSPTLGDENAKVTIVEFFDPACGTCKAFDPFLKGAMEAYPGKIRLVMRYLPLHQGSDEVVKILEAAHQQDKFWEILQASYESQSVWTKHHVVQPEEFWKMLSFTKLDVEKAKQDITSTVIVKRIEQDIADAKKLNVTKTPGFFVNGKPLTSFGYQQLKDLIETELGNKYPELKRSE